MLIRKKKASEQGAQTTAPKPSRAWKRSVTGRHSFTNTNTIFAPSADTSDVLRPLLACKTLRLIIQQLCTESCALAGFTPAEKPAGMLPLLPLSSIPSFLFLFRSSLFLPSSEREVLSFGLGPSKLSPLFCTSLPIHLSPSSLICCAMNHSSSPPLPLISLFSYLHLSISISFILLLNLSPPLLPFLH